MDVKFPVGSNVVVECESRSNYEGKVIETMPVYEYGLYYKVESDDSNEGTLWVAERRLELSSKYDGMESWDMC